MKRISLLSGGERALTAMAFLFAIFTARPSPFYFMDEVEPALDDVNLHRFLRLVEGFAARSQVLIVTHQKRTMETAGMMYGVSMGADGTSKVICQRLEQSAPAAAEAPRSPRRGPSSPRVGGEDDRADAGRRAGRRARPLACRREYHRPRRPRRWSSSWRSRRGLLLRRRPRSRRRAERAAAADSARPHRRPRPSAARASGAKVRALFGRGAAEDTWRELEDLLLRADVGPRGAADLVARIRERYAAGADPAELLARRDGRRAGTGRGPASPDGPARRRAGRRRERLGQDDHDRQAGLEAGRRRHGR